MKRNTIIALSTAATALAAGIATYIIKKRRNKRQPEQSTLPPQSHHMTDVFSRAKQHATAH
jgi:hypothetical protein